MCGISGIVNYRRSAPPVNNEELLRIREAMIHRGPDGAGIWVSEDRHVGLAHRRLSIIDLSDSAAQPMGDAEGGDAEGRIHLVFNGEIYNYLMLKKRLQAEGACFRTNSDTEVLLHLYLKYGADMVNYLRGMFAFALWDKQKQRLLMARDPLGIKPLYYADDGKTVRFASQVKALLAGGGIRTQLNPAGLVGFYLWGHVPEPFTIHRNICSLRPGTLICFDLGKKPVTSSYCHALDVFSARENNAGVQFGLRQSLRDSIEHRLVADVPVGVFQSAGIDSTAISSLASRIQAQPLRTVTLGFTEYKGAANDEVPLAERVAAEIGAQHQTCWVERKDFEIELPNILAAMDQPTVDGVNTHFISKVAAETGLKVALSGVGGDEFFQGYPSFSQVPKLVNWVSRVPAVAQLGKGFRRVTAPFLKTMTSPKYAGLLEYGGTFGGAFLLRRGLYMPWELPTVLDPDLVREGWKQLHTMERLEATVTGLPNDASRISALETEWYLQSRLLRDTDWASMAHSIEIRTPLVDIDLLSVFTQQLRGNPGPSKTWLANAAEIPLYETLTKRPKSGFTVPVRDWLLAAGDSDTGARGLRGWAKFIGKQCGWDVN